MKNLLISTDFSANATHAAEYGYKIARQIRANLILCNTIIVPGEIPMAGTINWPLDEYDSLMEESSKELTSLKEHLEKTGNSEGFRPAITCLNASGILGEIVNDISQSHDIDLIVMGSHGNNWIGTFLLGDHCRALIEAANKPVLLVPPGKQNFPIKRIALAVDFNEPDKDLASLYDLISLARFLNAEILLVHVSDGKLRHANIEKRLSQYLIEISNKADYPHIYYRIINDIDAENGLVWLCEDDQFDVLAMIHHKHGFFGDLLKASHTKAMAKLLTLPLLAMPGKN